MRGTKIKITIIGLDRAGKTCMLQRLKIGRFIADTTPTIGMNAEIFEISGAKIYAWDLGGQLQFRRALWKMYTQDSAGLIYVVDMSDPARFPEARLNFWEILREQHLEGVPIAVFANKVDLIDCTKKDLANALGLITKLNKILKIFETSVKTGEGIYEGIYWLVDAIEGNSQYLRTFPHLKSLFRRPKTILAD